MTLSQQAIQTNDSFIPAAETIFNQNQPFWWDAARIIEDDFTFPLYEKAPGKLQKNKGKRQNLHIPSKSGHFIYSVPANKDYSDIAITDTIRSATMKHWLSEPAHFRDCPVLSIKPDDIMKKVRICNKRSLIVFLVDLSWSMSVTQRMKATKNTITTILTKAYQFRDDICLITFQKDSASIVISPTHSVILAEKSMRNMKVGGKTPLSAGLDLAYEVVQTESAKYGKENICLVLLSDCEGNVSLIPNKDPREEADEAASRIRSEGIRTIVINSDEMSFGQGYANRLAHTLNASCYLISGFNAEHLIKAMQKELIL